MKLKLKTLMFGALLCVSVCGGGLQVLAQNNRLASTGPVKKSEVEQWRADLRLLAEEMPKRHRNLFHAMTREQFEEALKKLDERLPTLSRDEFVIEIARIVAMTEDGHTNLADFAYAPARLGFHSYPLTLYFYKDGLFVQSADREYANVVGARLLRIGNMSVEQALAAVRPLIFHDQHNEMGIKYFAPIMLVTPEILRATGVIGKTEDARFLFERGGQQTTLTPKQMMRPNWEGNGSNFFKLPGWVDARDAATQPVPLWLKDVENLYWFEYLEDSRTVYVQYNGVANKDNGESIADFAKRLFAFVESHPVDRLVLDLRNNGGGNNFLNKPLLLGLIKSKVDERGKFFTIIGRRTFSAAQNFVNELEKYTNTIFVGEPTAENVNFYGDQARIPLPNSKLVVRTSTLWWQNMDPRDKRQWTGPQLAAELTSEDYRTNNDPAMKAIFGYSAHRELTDLLMEALNANDTALAAKRFREYRADPVNAYLNVEGTMNTFGYTLMGMKRLPQAIEMFKLNVEAYPQSSNVYDSLGEAYMKHGDKELAIKNYEKSLELDPNNAGAVIALKELRGQ
jgi:tetratricopeptide (TPR) repeat protein